MQKLLMFVKRFLTIIYAIMRKLIRPVIQVISGVVSFFYRVQIMILRNYSLLICTVLSILFVLICLLFFNELMQLHHKSNYLSKASLSHMHYAIIHFKAVQVIQENLNIIQTFLPQAWNDFLIRDQAELGRSTMEDVGLYFLVISTVHAVFILGFRSSFY